jgi:hypothetical protein
LGWSGLNAFPQFDSGNGWFKPPETPFAVILLALKFSLWYKLIIHVCPQRASLDFMQSG